MHPADKYILFKLEQRQQAGNLRRLKLPGGNLIDFSSNDYLGFARSEKLKQFINTEINIHPAEKNGSTGSRLLTGNSQYAEELEEQIAAYHSHPSALLFSSGYDANLGLFSSLPQRGDTVITDELIHASIIDGIRLSNANRYTFMHNDLQSLEEKLRHAKGNIYVAVETVYSMDGDMPDIKGIITLCEKYNAILIVDEAHAIGVFGKGIVDGLCLQDHIFARVITYGKAMGTHGAAILGSKNLRKYLINFARSFIYSTAAPFYQLAAIRMGYKMLEDSKAEYNKLHENIRFFNDNFHEDQLITRSQSAIHCLKAGSNEKAKYLSEQLLGASLDVRPILNPTVKAGTERLRVCLHSYNKVEEIKLLADIINNSTIHA